MQKVLANQARTASFGQDTSVQYPRDDGKKAWRAEHPATSEDKAAGRANFAVFKTAWRLDSLTLDAVHQRHAQYLQSRLDGADPSRTKWFEGRLARTHAARAARRAFTLVADAELSISESSDFVSYVHGEAHGTRTPMRAKARTEHYKPGALRGAPLAAHPASPVLSASEEGAPALSLPSLLLVRYGCHEREALPPLLRQCPREEHPARESLLGGRLSPRPDGPDRRGHLRQCSAAPVVSPAQPEDCRVGAARGGMGATGEIHATRREPCGSLPQLRRRRSQGGPGHVPGHALVARCEERGRAAGESSTAPPPTPPHTPHTSPPHLPHFSPTSPQHLPHISPTSPPHLPHIPPLLLDSIVRPPLTRLTTT